MAYSKKTLVYCDSAAAMPLLPSVNSWLTKWLSDPIQSQWGINLSSEHAIGKSFHDYYEAQTSALFQSLKCTPSEWFWTSGATESNEWALQIAMRSQPSLKIIVVHPLAHPSLSLAAQRLGQQNGLELVILPLKEGSLYEGDWKSLEKNYDLSKILLATPYGDHELGSLESCPSEFSQMGWIHIDGSQSFAKIACDFRKLPCTSFACSSSKIGALPGLGGLFVRFRPKKTIPAIFIGGSQQNAVRAGTLPALSIFSFCVAYESWRMENYSSQLSELKRAFSLSVLEDLSAVIHTPEQSLPTILTFELPKASENALIRLKSELAFSQGSACEKGQGSTSLRLIGISLERQRLMIRLGLSLQNIDQKDSILALLQTLKT